MGPDIQTDATPSYWGEVRAAWVIGLPSVHKCATLNGLGVGTPQWHADADPRRCALSRRALREFPVLLVLETPAGRTALLCGSGLGLSTFSTAVLLFKSCPPQGHRRFGPHPRGVE